MSAPKQLAIWSGAERHVRVSVESLRPLLLGTSAITLADLQAVLGLDKRSAKKAAGLLVRCGFLEIRPTSLRPGAPVRYALGRMACRILNADTGSPIPAQEVQELQQMLWERVRGVNRSAESCHISKAALSGSVLKDAVPRHDFIEAEVTIDVRAQGRPIVEMKGILKSLLTVGDRSLKLKLLVQEVND